MHLTHIYKEVLISLSAVLILSIGLITFPIFYTPIILYRQTVKLLAKYLKPEFGEMLSGISALLAAWGVHSKPKTGNNRRCSITMSFIIANTKIDLDKIQDIGQILLNDNNFINAKMTLVKWMGFYFWKHPDNFDFKSHLILHEIPITQTEFENLTENEINNEPYRKEKPLWEMHLFPKYLPTPMDSSEQAENYCLVAFKFHHCLADMVSSVNVINAINRCLIQNNLIPLNSHDASKNVQPISKRQVASKNAITESNYKMLLFVLKLVLYGPYDFVRGWIKSTNTTIKNVTNIKPLNKQESFQLGVPYEYVKEIAHKNGVSTPVLTVAAFTGALRKLIIDLDVRPFPEKVSVSLPVPLPWTRPKDLGIYVSAVYIYAPVNEEDKFKRLDSVAKQIKDIQTSIKPLAHYFVYEIVGSLFYWMLEPTSAYRYGGTNCSLAPGGTKDLRNLLGIDIKGFRITGGVPYGNFIMLGFHSGHVNGNVEFGVCGDKALYKNSNSKQFIETLVQELESYNHGTMIKVL